MLKFISFCFLSLLFANLSLFGGNPLLPETQQNKETPKICFTENKGQVYDQNYKPRPDVLYGAMAGNMAVHIKNNGVSYQLYRVDKYKEVEDPKTKEKRQEIDQQTIYRVDLYWLNANKNFTKSEDEALPGYNNYYLENCPNGALNVKSYKGISLNNLYPGINLHYYDKNGELKHDYIVAPHADYKQIQIKIEGAEISVNKDGSLLLKTPLGKIQEGAPLVYQNGKQLKAEWKLKGNALSFEIDSYNPNYELIIDPVTRLWGTYYGGAVTDYGNSCSTDASNNFYLAGLTTSNTGTVIATNGIHQSIFGGTVDAFLVKFNIGGQRLWGTYYGGAGDDRGYSSSTDGFGNAYLVGYTDSNTGTAIATVGSHQPTYGGGTWDPFLVKFNSAGQRQWGTYYGGTAVDRGTSCSTDALGNVYLAGYTDSNTGTVIATPGTHQFLFGGGNTDAFLVKFNGAGQRQWGTYYGGSGWDYGFSCSTDASGNVYLAGTTPSNTGTVIATIGSHQSLYGGSTQDAFLVKFDGTGQRLWGTYYGGTGQDWGYSCTTSISGDVYLSGNTNSNIGTVIATAVAHQITFGGFNDGFLVKFNSNGVRQWGTYYGGIGQEWGYSCVTDSWSSVYLAGYTDSNTGSSIATVGSFQPFHGGGIYDAYLVKFNALGQRQWGTYYGDTGNGDISLSCCSDLVGNIYLAGYTDSSTGTVIATVGSNQPTFGGGTADAFVVKFTDCVAITPTASVNSTVCIGSALSFIANISGTANPTYSWSGPASFTSSVQNPSIVSSSTANIGIYTLTVNNVGCVETATTSVNMIYNLPIISVNNGSICSGQTYTISPAGANTFTITGGNFTVNPASTTSYSITGTSTAGCVSASAAICNVTVHPNPTVSVNSGSICSGNSFTITPSGANSYIITGGSFTVNPPITSSYSITGTSSEGCTSTSATISNVTVNPTPSIQVNSGNICSGESFTISPSGASTYSIAGGNFLVSPNTTTSYSVTGTSTAGCVSAAAVSTVNVSECVGISENPGINPSSIKIFPNPNNGLLNVESDSDAQVLVFDL